MDANAKISRLLANIEPVKKSKLADKNCFFLYEFKHADYWGVIQVLVDFIFLKMLTLFNICSTSKESILFIRENIRFDFVFAMARRMENG